MIIRKPYAFLIKHFRIIHLLLSIFTLYIALKTHSIFIFFNDYAKNGYYNYSGNLAGSYINLYMFIAIIFILLLSSFIYLLMRWKKKSRTFYLVTIGVYFALFIGLLVYFNLFNTILNTTLDVRTVRLYRDISAIMYFPQYIFFIICAVRATGFNIKKFDFKKDLEELDIAEEDQEEVELTLGKNNYKIARFFRRRIREIKYYAVENRFFFWTIIGIISLVFIFIIYYRFNINGKTYKESEYFNIDGIVFKVTESFVTDVDLNGNKINEDKNYILVNLNIENTNRVKSSLSVDTLRLRVDKENYYPIYSKNDYFIDLGEGYYKNTLYAGQTYDYLLVYEIPSNSNYNDAILRMVNSISLKDGELEAKYKDVKLKPKEYIADIDIENYGLGDAISLERSSLKNSEIIVNSYEVADEFTETFTYCTSTCYNGKKIIKPDLLSKGKTTIVKLNVESSLDESLYINRYIKSSADLLSYFGKISYIKNGIEYISSYNIVKLENIETNNVYIEVNDDIKNAETIYLNLNIRNQGYSISIK